MLAAHPVGGIEDLDAFQISDLVSVHGSEHARQIVPVHAQSLFEAHGIEGLKYLISTNELDREKLPTEELLTVYKDQNRSVERGFRFLKDPFFFASRFFLKKPSRIMALLMVMGLSLLIYALAEQTLRSKLAESGQSIPDQKGNPTQGPTMRRVFQMFEGIHILLIETGQVRKRMVLNVQEVHLKIAGLLGESILQFYLLSD